MIIDTHTHLDMEQFNDDRDAVVERAIAAGVKKIVSVGVDLDSSAAAIGLARKYDSVYAAVGIQPEEIHKYSNWSEVTEKLSQLAEKKEVVALGECGLDYKLIRSSNILEEGEEKERQKEVLRRHLGLAVSTDLPVIVHNRDADEDIIREIQRYRETKRLRGVIHCFAADSAEGLKIAERVIDLGFFVSFSGIISFPNAKNLREIVREIPLNKILVETDSPFIAPQPFRGKRNEPAFTVEVVKEIANIKNLDFEDVSSATSENAQHLFKF